MAMTMHRRLVLCVIFLAVLVAPRTAYAGLGDLIWEMSGPMMIGWGLECDFVIKSESGKVPSKPDCNLFGRRLVSVYAPRITDRRLWMSFESRLFYSTGRNPKPNGDEIEFLAFRARMIG